MIVTHTELIDTLRKIFEGLGYALGEDDEYAKTVAWLAMRGVSILGDLVNAPTAFKPALRVNVLEENAERIVIEGGAGNVMAISADLLRHKRESSNLVTLIIKDCPLPELFIPYLAEIGGVAKWAGDMVQQEVSAQGWITTLTAETFPLTVTTDAISQPFELFQKRYQTHLEKGLHVPDSVWGRLKTLAQAVLVPESEYSRQHGAGYVASPQNLPPS